MTALRSLVLSSRPLSWVNTAFPFAVAYYVATGSVDVVLVVGTVFFLIPYNVLMYGINDVFDYESDVLNPRKGGAEGALLAPELHRPMLWTSTLLALPFVVWLVFQGGVASWAMLALSLVSVVAYSTPPLRCKEIPGLDSVTSPFRGRTFGPNRRFGPGRILFVGDGITRVWRSPGCDF